MLIVFGRRTFPLDSQRSSVTRVTPTALATCTVDRGLICYYVYHIYCPCQVFCERIFGMSKPGKIDDPIDRLSSSPDACHVTRTLLSRSETYSFSMGSGMSRMLAFCA